MRTKTTERIVSSKIIRVVMSMALALSVCVSAPMSALAAESVDVTIGDDIPYAGYSTTRMYADGEVAYCADPASATPAPGTYSKSGVSDPDLIATMWFSYGAPGFDASMFPDTWYDGSGWSAEKYIVASHVLLSYAYQGSKSDAAFGTSGDFEDWARSELLDSTWKSIKASKDKVSTGFEAFCIHTGPGTQVLMSFTWDKGGLKVAKEDPQAGAEPQGDATLDGVKYDIVNESGQYALVDGKYYANGEVVKTITGHWDGDAGAFVAKTSSDALPCSTYAVVESQAPEGYLVTDWSAKAEIKSDKQVVDLTGDPCDDDVIRGGVQVTKSDGELQASEALGSNSHDAFDTGSTLSGIEFTIANESEHEVLVGDKWFEPGGVIKTVVTSWNDEEKAYTAQTAADELPYGTYTIQETKTNDSYLLTDGEPKTFQVRENGAIVKATPAGGEFKFFDQVVRNDLEVVKMAEDTNASLQVAFKVANVSTGEALLDGDGNAITATKTFQPRHKAGEVQLEFTFDSSLLAGEDIVAFESLFAEGVEVAAHADIADEGQTVHFLDIHTTAADKTGVDLAPIAAIVVIALLAGSGCLAYGLRKRRLAAAADVNSEDYDNESDES